MAYDTKGENRPEGWGVAKMLVQKVLTVFTMGSWRSFLLLKELKIVFSNTKEANT